MNVITTTNTWNEGGGHAVCVTGIIDDFIIVSSWGKRLRIPISDFINNEFSIIFRKNGGNRMNNLNFIDEEYLLLERPDLKEECNINSPEEMKAYLIAYNVYNNLLIQFLMNEYFLVNVDQELIKHSDKFKSVQSENMDLYQHSSLGFLRYFYLRNNIYVERLSIEDRNYLYSIYNNQDLRLDEQKKAFIQRTYLNVIIERPTEKNHSTNYGPDNKKYIRPTNAIIIGVRYDQFSSLPSEEKDLFNSFADLESQLSILTGFLEYKVKLKTNIPFFVIKYDEYSVKCKNKKNQRNSVE